MKHPKNKKKQPSPSKCRSCGSVKTIPRYLYFRASSPKCHGCGGLMDYLGLLNGFSSEKHQQKQLDKPSARTDCHHGEFLVTDEWLRLHSGNGRAGWTNKQFKALGIPIPARKGWLSNLVGEKITLDQKTRFEQARIAKSGPVTAKPLSDLQLMEEHMRAIQSEE